MIILHACTDPRPPDHRPADCDHGELVCIEHNHRAKEHVQCSMEHALVREHHTLACLISKGGEARHPHAFIARTAVPRHPLTLSHYWVKYFVRLDAMHAKDLRGLHAIAAGSLIMHIITNCNALGVTQQERLDRLNERM